MICCLERWLMKYKLCFYVLEVVGRGCQLLLALVGQCCDFSLVWTCVSCQLLLARNPRVSFPTRPCFHANPLCHNQKIIGCFHMIIKMCFRKPLSHSATLWQITTPFSWFDCKLSIQWVHNISYMACQLPKTPHLHRVITLSPSKWQC